MAEEIEYIVDGYKGYRVITDTVSRFRETTGMWEITMIYKALRSVDLEEWDERSVEYTASSESQSRALAEVSTVIAKYLENNDFDLFSIVPDEQTNAN